MSSLMQRLLTAVVLIPIVVWVVLFAPERFFLVVASVIVWVAAYEWVALSGVLNKLHKILLASLMLGFGHILLLLDTQILSYLLLVSLAFWLFIVLFIITWPKQLLEMRQQPVVMLLLGHVLLGLTLVSLYLLRHSFALGAELLMYLLLLIWIADSGAYFAGRALGARKLSAIISPGKSIEGVVGGLLTCLLFAVFMAGYFEVVNALGFIGLSLLVVLVSVYGDLFESLLKRRAKVKDSGNILPGHGGMLDRIDSLIAAAPVFAASLLLTEVLL